MGDHTTAGLTWADLQDFPDDGQRRELLDGVLHVNPSPVARHQRVVLLIARELLAVVELTGGHVYPAPLDVVFDEFNVVEPDVLVFSARRLGVIRDGYPRAAPDLAVEVSSPSTRGVDRVRKRALYERFGVSEYWLVDLDGDTLEAYRLDAAGGYGPPTRFGPGDVVTSTAVPGFAVAYERLVPPPDWQ